jgi:parallel beta-helix repeat protein
MMRVTSQLALATLLVAGASAHAETVKLTPANTADEIQEAFILGEPGTVFEFAEGTYAFTLGLSLDLDGATIKGAGMEKTIFTFKEQEAGAEGVLVTADDVTIKDFAIEDAKGNAFKSNAANNLKLINVRTEWTGGPKASNGAYGLYPVSSTNVLIDGCVAIGASDAGIYVGQTKNVIVRNSRAEYNVAGIEIENCHSADVYDNIATNNTGGILVFDMPGLPMQRGHDVRVFKNKVYNNDTANFAPPGNIVGKVAQGTGVMIMSNSNVHVFENDIRDHRSYNILVCSYLAAGEEIKDPNYYPYPEAIYIHGNTIGKGGWAPAGDIGMAAAALLGGTLPDIVWDGFLNAEVAVDGKLPEGKGIYIENNKKEEGELTFANLQAGGLLSGTAATPKRDLAEHAGSLPPLAPVEIPGV